MARAGQDIGKMIDFAKLHEPFPKDAISWRSQSLTRDGKKAMALAYIDARDVMERLDAVCGPAGWQCEHFDAGSGRIGCKIGLFMKDGDYGQWVWKSDGAGATQVEGDKGSFSDAFKRAAVQWGVGRYLYALDAPWVPCETYEKNGKQYWKAWKESPWNFVKKEVSEAAKGSVTKAKEVWRDFKKEMDACVDESSLDGLLCAPRTHALMERWKVVIPEWMDTIDSDIAEARERTKDA